MLERNTEFMGFTDQQDRRDLAIAVIGMGCQYPGAKDLKTLWENILTKRCQFRTMPDVRLPAAAYFDADPSVPDKTYGRYGAVIDGFEFDWVNRRIPKATVDSTDTVHWLAVAIAEQALLDAGLTRQTVPTQKTGVIVGNTLTGEESRTSTLRLRWPHMERSLRAAATVRGLPSDATDALIETTKLFYKSVFPEITEDSLAGGLANTIAGRVCNYFNLDGGGYTVDGACASSLLALITAAKALTLGDLDLALVGGVDMSLDPFELVGFAKTGALAPERMTVYDRHASGFIPGEGCGFVVLKRLEDARRDGNYVYAVLNGWGISSDGKGGITAPTSGGQAKALLRAYEKAGYSPKTLDFIEGHGTGTPKGDRIELEGIALALSADGPAAARQVGVTSFKSLVGHTKAAAGIGGFIKAVMAVNQRVIPPTVGCKEPNPVFNTAAQSVYPILNGVIRDPSDTLRAGVSAMGFGGINSHVTLASADGAKQNLQSSLGTEALLASAQDTELFICSGGSVLDLLNRVQAIHDQAVGLCIGDLVDFAQHLSTQVNEHHSLRAAIVADHPDVLLTRLLELRSLLQTQPPLMGEVKTLAQRWGWVSHSVQRSRVAFLFPGQGSQKLNMGRTLLGRCDWAKALVAQGNVCFRTDDREQELNLSDVIYRLPEHAVDETQLDEWNTDLAQSATAQPAICLTSLLWLRYLNTLGITPCVVGGHSLGELTAFHAAGAFDEQTLLSFAVLRGQLMTAPSQSTGKMAGLACDRHAAQRLLEQVSGYGVIANLNSPQQTVISGEAATVDAVVALAIKAEIQATVLPVSNAFHSQFMEPAAVGLNKNSPIPEQLTHTTIPIVSSMDSQGVPAGTPLKAYFAKQVTSPIDFVSQVKAISSQCDLMVEVGPGRVLSTLVGRIQAVDEPMCLPLESKPGQFADLNTFLATYFIHGGSVRWDKLYENRLVRPFRTAGEHQFFVNPCERPFNVSEAELAKHSSFGSLSFSSQNFQGGLGLSLGGIGPLKTQDGVESGNFSAHLASENALPLQEDALMQVLSQYFERRSGFLANVIQIDLENLP